MARHIQEKLKSLIHEVQHAIQVREGNFAVGEKPLIAKTETKAQVKSRLTMLRQDKV